MAEALGVRGAAKRFGEVHALQGAELDVAERELVALLGPNGAGKTTLIRAIAGRVRLDAGSILLFGEPAEARGAADRRRLGVVPQEIALYGLLTARENLQSFGLLHGVRGAELRERVDWALEWTELGARADEPIRRYSSGMKRRLNIACGLLHRPRLVLLDEPTVGLDPQSRERIWGMLDSLQASGAALLLATHQLEEAQEHCDRIVILDRGKTVAAGTLSELVRRTGGRHEVVIALDRPLEEGLEGFGGSTAGKELRLEIEDLSAELPELLARLKARSLQVESLVVRGPSLQTVFLQLTGRELRE